MLCDKIDNRIYTDFNFDFYIDYNTNYVDDPR